MSGTTNSAHNFTVTGLRDLLTGEAPASVLASKKAIEAAISNYELEHQLKASLEALQKPRVGDPPWFTREVN